MTVSEIPSADQISAVLVGGPTDLPVSARTVRVDPAEPTVKIVHRGGYEHFERDSEVGGDAAVVFRWTTRTRIAE
jgi:hypothetical protein